MDYDDILDLPRPVSREHEPMKRCDRAAQFAPFAALSGHDDAVAATAKAVERAFESQKTSCRR